MGLDICRQRMQMLNCHALVVFVGIAAGAVAQRRRASPLFVRRMEMRRVKRGSLALEALKYMNRAEEFDAGVYAGAKDLTELLRLFGNSEGGPLSAPRCGTCAVVGAAGTLANSFKGVEIDAHDCVFRVNMAITQTFEKHVGKRTTVHVWGLPTTPGNLGERGFLEKVQLTLAEFAHAAENISVVYSSHPEAIKRVLELALEERLPVKRMRVYHPALLLELCRSIGIACDPTSRPSTGIMTAYLAMRLCALPPRLYGFDPDSVPFHYYDPPDHVCDALVGARIGGQGSAHNFDYEREQLVRWKAEGRVHLWQTKFSQKPNSTSCDIPKVMNLHTKYSDLAGEYKVQPYVVNGKAVYEKRDSRGEDYIRMLYFSLCQMSAGRSGAWVILPFYILMLSQKQTPGQDGSCMAAAYSTDFRPETPEKATWFITGTEGKFTQEPFIWRVIRRY